jgi:hypothetical protein
MQRSSAQKRNPRVRKYTLAVRERLSRITRTYKTCAIRTVNRFESDVRNRSPCPRSVIRPTRGDGTTATAKSVEHEKPNNCTRWGAYVVRTRCLNLRPFRKKEIVRTRVRVYFNGLKIIYRMYSIYFDLEFQWLAWVDRRRWQALLITRRLFSDERIKTMEKYWLRTRFCSVCFLAISRSFEHWRITVRCVNRQFHFLSHHRLDPILLLLSSCDNGPVVLREVINSVKKVIACIIRVADKNEKL